MVSWSLAGKKSLFTVLGEKVAKTVATSRVRIRVVLLVALRLCLQLAGLGLLSVAAWGVAWQLGVAAAGFSCFVFEWVIKR